MNKRKLFLVLFSLLGSGCAIQIPNTKVCTVSGILLNGGDCAYTLSDDTESMTFDQFMEFLEAQPERPDPDRPGSTLPARGGALCQSADDWNAQKTALEKLCKKYKGACTFEMKQAVARVSHLAEFKQSYRKVRR